MLKRLFRDYLGLSSLFFDVGAADDDDDLIPLLCFEDEWLEESSGGNPVDTTVDRCRSVVPSQGGLCFARFLSIFF